MNGGPSQATVWQRNLAVLTCSLVDEAVKMAGTAAVLVTPRLLGIGPGPPREICSYHLLMLTRINHGKVS